MCKGRRRAGGASVVHADVAEQVGHGLAVVDAADGLRQDHADVHRFDLRTLQLLYLVGDRVGHHHLGGEKRREGGGASETGDAGEAGGPTSSMADSSMNRGASQDRMPCVAMTKIL